MEEQHKSLSFEDKSSLDNSRTPTLSLWARSGVLAKIDQYEAGSIGEENASSKVEGFTAAEEKSGILPGFDLSSYSLIKWGLGLKWYVVVSIFIFAAFLFFQIEESIESRKLKKNAPTKSETQPKIKKGIIRSNKEKRQTTKHVSFLEDVTIFNNISKIVINIQKQIYNWWVRPWYYVLFRNIKG